MKHVLSLALAVFSCTAFSEVVSLSNAVCAVGAWLRGWSGDSESVSYAFTVSNSVGPAYHIVRLSDDRCVITSADTGLDPIMAVVSDALDGNGNPKSGLPLWDMLSVDCDYSETTNAPKMSTARKTAGSRRMPSWSDLLRGQRTSSRILLSSGSVTSPSEYVLGGFESGGPLTHWGQTTDSISQMPLYNYYMHDSRSGGPSSGGLQLDFSRDDGVFYKIDAIRVPCGCVATAHAAVLQYESVTGCVYDAAAETLSVSYPNRYFFDGVTWSETDSVGTAVRIPVQTTFAWWKLPESCGGKSSYPLALFWGSSVSDGARATVGAAAYDCGVAVSMGYGWSASSAYTQDFRIRMSRNKCFVKFPGFCVRPYRYSWSWSDQVADDWIRSGHPVVMSISNSSSGHCVLGVGRNSSTGLTRVFMGWGGSGDGWYNTSSVNIQGYSSISSMYTLTDSRSGSVSVYGRVVSGGNPVSDIPVFVRYGGVLSGVSVSDSDGYFRMLYRPEVFGSNAETVEVGGVTVSSRVRTVSVSTNSTTGTGVYYCTEYQEGMSDVGTVSIAAVPGYGYSAVISNRDELALLLYDRAKLFDPVFVCCFDDTPAVTAPDGIYSVLATTNVFENSSAGEYVVIDPRKCLGDPVFRESDAIIGYGVSTNAADVAEYVRKAKLRLQASFEE